jgi:hypothetical protein
MVKIACIAYLVERYFRMALSAVLSEPVLVHIPVAVGAIAVVHSPEHLEFIPVAGFGFVAFDTLNLPVLSFQREGRIVVVEPGGGAELAEIVTGGAFYTQCSLVVIGVAGEAFLFQPQVGAGPVFQFFIRDEFFLMALAAVYLSVLPLQNVPGKPVFEAILLEPDHLEFPSVMVVVAGSTFIAFHIGGDMIPPPGFDPGIDLLVAGETFFVRHLLPENVAFGAVGHPLQVFMSFSQIARRELGRYRKDR